MKKIEALGQIKAKNRRDAWAIVNEIFPAEYTYDAYISGKYDVRVFSGSIGEVKIHVEDLEDALVVKSPFGNEIDIWIDDGMEDF